MKTNRFLTWNCSLAVLGLFLSAGLAENSPDAIIVEKGRAKAKELGYNPVPVYLNEDDTIAIVSGTQFSIRDGSFALVKGDMVINAGAKPVPVGGHKLEKGEYATVDANGFNKGPGNLAGAEAAKETGRVSDFSKLAPGGGVPLLSRFEAIAAFGAVPKEHQAKWFSGLAGATGVAIDNDALRFVYIQELVGRHLRIMFDENGKCKPEISEKMLRRLGSLTEEEITKWYEIQKGIEGGGNDLDKYEVAIVILTMDEFFGNDEYRAVQAEKALQRLRQLSKAVLDRWCEKVAAFQKSRFGAAVTIALLDQFFEGAKFDNAAFEKAMAEIK